MVYRRGGKKTDMTRKQLTRNTNELFERRQMQGGAERIKEIRKSIGDGIQDTKKYYTRKKKRDRGKRNEGEEPSR